MYANYFRLVKPDKIWNTSFQKVLLLQRSSTEAQSAESPADFLHKMKLVLKEIRETRVNLKIIEQKPMIKHQKVDLALDEAGQLMAIFLKSIETTKNNHPVKQKNSNLPVKTPDFLF